MREGTCPFCRGKVDFDLETMCGNCGGDLLRTAVTLPPASPDSAPEPAASPEPARSPTGDWFCASPGCGPVHAEFGECPYCGAPRPAAEERCSSDPGDAFRLRGDRILISLEGDGPWTIGREGDGGEALQLYDTVSRRHARIERSSGGLLVRDLCSANGTFVDGARVPDEREVPLLAGSHLSLGRSVELTLEASGR